MKAIIKPIFEIDLEGWAEDEKLTPKQFVKKLKEDFEDYYIFMPHCEYQNFKGISIQIKE